MRTLIFIFYFCSWSTLFSQVDYVIRSAFYDKTPDDLKTITETFNKKYRKDKISISIGVEFNRNLTLDYYATQYKLEYNVWADTTFESASVDYYYINIFSIENKIISSTYIDTNRSKINIASDQIKLETMLKDYNATFKTQLDTAVTFATKKTFDVYEFPDEIMSKAIKSKSFEEINVLLQSQYPEDRLNGIRLINKIRQKNIIKLGSNTLALYRASKSTKGIVFSCWADNCSWPGFQEILKEISKN